MTPLKEFIETNGIKERDIARAAGVSLNIIKNFRETGLKMNDALKASIIKYAKENELDYSALDDKFRKKKQEQERAKAQKKKEDEILNAMQAIIKSQDRTFEVINKVLEQQNEIIKNQTLMIASYESIIQTLIKVTNK